MEIEGFTQEQKELLDAPLQSDLICHRPDGKKYLKGSTEFENANRIFGYGRWGYKVLGRTLQKVYDLDDRVVGLYFSVEVEVYVAGALFPFYGDGGQSIKYYTPQGYEDASKAATTDAVKRALRHYGSQFGLPLYNEDSLVDAGDGTLVQVKEVLPQKNTVPHRRVVDVEHARQLPPPQNNAQATKEALTPSFNQLVEAGILDESEQGWLKFCKMIIGWLKLSHIRSSQQLLETLTESQVEMIKNHVVAEVQKAA